MQEKSTIRVWLQEKVVEIGYAKTLPKRFGICEKVVEKISVAPNKDVNNRSDVRKSRQKEIGYANVKSR